MRRLIILIALITALALPAQALAQSVSPNAAGATQYVPPTPPTVAVAVCRLPNGQVVPLSSVVANPSGDPSGSIPLCPTRPTVRAALPFTGEDVLLVVLAGLLLLGGGLTLYRQAKQR